MSYSFYSQQGEDTIVLKNFINKYCPDGFFVELGAMDGVTYSNTLFFEKQMGFKGLLIEPTKNFDKLKEARPECINLNCAVGYNDNQEVEFIEEGAVAGMTETMTENFSNDHKSSSTYKVITKRMDTILRENNVKYIDLFSLDVEGGELTVLETMDWTIPVYCMVIELDGGNINKDEKCREILRKQGFTFVSRVSINEFWINKNYFRRDLLHDVNETFDLTKTQSVFYFIAHNIINELFQEFNKTYNWYDNNTLTEEDKKKNSFIKLQEFMENKFQKKEPFFVGRLSGNETTLAGKILSNDSTVQIHQSLIVNILSGAGIRFTNDQDLIDYSIEYYDSVLNCNMLGTFDGIVGDQANEFNKLLNKSKTDIEKFDATSFEFFCFLNEPFYKIDSIFENKTILVILSHEETLKQQLTKLDLIYPDENKIRNQGLFRNTKFITYKPAQQHCGLSDGQAWKVHMNKMKQDLSKIVSENNIDVAFVSCGGFSMGLCNYIYKELKTSAIYFGGGLQLFFGILGERWISYFPHIMKFSNSHWIRPLDIDTPKSKQLCENGSYW